jgi:excisionase family DNA binding protein
MACLREIPPLLSVRETADLLRLPVAKVRAAIAAGELPVHRFGGRVFVATRDLLVQMGVRADHPELPAAVPPSKGGH